MLNVGVEVVVDCGKGERVSMTISQNSNAGIPSSLRLESRAIISASVDEWLTAVCFLQNQLNGVYVLGPTSTKYDALVDLLSDRLPAKDASQNKAREMSSGRSPIQFAWDHSRVA